LIKDKERVALQKIVRSKR